MESRPLSRHAGTLFLDEAGGAPARDRRHSSSSSTAAQNADLLSLESRLGREEAHELKEMFRLIDKGGAGSIAREEFEKVVQSMSIKTAPSEIELMCDEMDAQRHGIIEYTEFLRFMTQPGIKTSNGATLLEAFQYVEGFQYDCGKGHPATSGKTGHGGVLNLADLALALRTFLPDLVHSEKESLELVKHLATTNPSSPSAAAADATHSVFDYRTYVRESVRAETLPPMNEAGEFVLRPPPQAKNQKDTDEANTADTDPSADATATQETDLESLLAASTLDDALSSPASPLDDDALDADESASADLLSPASSTGSRTAKRKHKSGKKKGASTRRAATKTKKSTSSRNNATN